ncbi:hypothetical protein GCM10027416_08040 [Okibacterium endophyticum]
MSSEAALRHRPRANKRKRRIWLWVVLGLVVVILAAGAWIAIRGLMAKSSLEAAIPLAGELASAVVAGDTEQVASLSDTFTEHVDEAASLTSDPIWRVAEIVPGGGPNLTAFREASAVARDVAHDAVGPLATMADGIDIAALRPVDGAVDLTVLTSIREPVALAADALRDAQARTQAISTDNIIGPVRSGVEQLAVAVSDASESVSALHRVAELLPAMLGTDGPRSYLLMFQNSAELRATGGIAGALAVVGTDAGRVDLTAQATASSFPRLDPPLSLPPETQALYGDITGSFMADVNLTPQFPVAASLAREMWRLRSGAEVDGVIAVDPVMLSYLLRATGPITLPTGDELNADNAVQLLLSDVYARYPDAEAQDAFFAAAAAAVFEKVAAGDLEPRALLESLVQAGEEHRILLWSAHEAEQGIIAETTLAGELPEPDNEHLPFGLYLNDATGAKMDYHLETGMSVGEASCRDDGTGLYTVGLTLTNTAPADAANVLPDAVTGPGTFGVQKGNIRTMITVYGALGSTGIGVIRDGAGAGYRPAVDNGYSVSRIFVELAPGESTTLEFGFVGDESGDREPVITHTPLVRPVEVAEATPNCDAWTW